MSRWCNGCGRTDMAGITHVCPPLETRTAGSTPWLNPVPVPTTGSTIPVTFAAVPVSSAANTTDKR